MEKPIIEIEIVPTPFGPMYNYTIITERREYKSDITYRSYEAAEAAAKERIKKL
jgi:hypothetical protein